MRLTDLYVVCRVIGIKDEIKAKFASKPKAKEEEEKKDEVKKEEVAAAAEPATEVAVVPVVAEVK